MIAYNKLLNIMKQYKKDASVNDVKKKINTLRSNYRREVKRIRDSKESGENPVYSPNLWWFEKFNFLKNLKTLRPSNNNCNTNQKEACVNEIMLDEEVDDDGEEDEGVYNLNLKTENETYERPVEETYIQSKNIVRPKRHQETYIQPMPKRVNRREDNLQTNYKSFLPTPTTTPPQAPIPTLSVGDTVDHMCKAWAGDLREMDKHQRIIAGRAISEIIFQGQIGVLTIDSIPKMPASSSQATEEFDYTQSQIKSEDSSPKPISKFYSNSKINHHRESISIEAERAIEQSFSSLPEKEFLYDQ